MSKKNYIPIGNPQLFGGIKIKNTECSVEEFHDSVFVKYASIVVPITNNKGIKKLTIQFYDTDNESNSPQKEIDTEKNSDLFFLISNKPSLIKVDENGIESQYEGKPVFINLQEFYHKTSIISWFFEDNNGIIGEKNYTIFPNTNINLSYGFSNSGGGTNPPDYPDDNYFLVTDSSTPEQYQIIIGKGAYFNNNQIVYINQTVFSFNNKEWSGYVVDVEDYDPDILFDLKYDENKKIIQGHATNETLDRDYIVSTKYNDFPCELKLAIFKNEGIISHEYTIENIDCYKIFDIAKINIDSFGNLTIEQLINNAVYV